MRVFWLLTCVCLMAHKCSFKVTAEPLNEEEGHINGENGWYIPLADGSLKWMDQKTVEAVQSYYKAIEDNAYADDLSESIGPADIIETTTVAEDSVRPAFVKPEIIENRFNGLNGWYVPFADGSLNWMDMETIEKIQSYENDLITTDVNDGNSSLKFWLYTALSPDKAEEISLKQNNNKATTFNPEHLTIFVVQTFLLDKYSVQFNATLRDTLFKKGNYNFVFVEWSGENNLNYIASCSQTPIVGKLMAKLFDALVKNYKMNCGSTHLIGYGLGAHIAGFAAKNINSCKVPIITALDPIVTFFPYNKPEQRLNSTDAQYVESIQTDGGFFGYVEPIGTASFYCNGGAQQPGCRKNNLCNHERSIKVFVEAIEKNSFLSYECDNLESAVSDKCSEQYSGVRLGDDNNKVTARGIYYVKTNEKSPYGTL